MWPPDLGSKMVDWTVLTAVGGDGLIFSRRVLELGPAYGFDTMLFSTKARHGWQLERHGKAGPPGRYVVVDTDKESIERVRHFAPDAEIVEADFRSLPLEDRSFDTVIDFSSLDDCPDPIASYREAARVLARDGTLVTTFSNGERVQRTPGQSPTSPLVVRATLEQSGLVHRYWAFLDQDRAAIVMVRP